MKSDGGVVIGLLGSFEFLSKESSEMVCEWIHRSPLSKSRAHRKSVQKIEKVEIHVEIANITLNCRIKSRF